MNDKCLEKAKQHCNDLDKDCMTQMDYYLIGKDCYDECKDMKFYDEEYIRIGKKLH